MMDNNLDRKVFIDLSQLDSEKDLDVVQDAEVEVLLPTGYIVQFPHTTIKASIQTNYSSGMYSRFIKTANGVIKFESVPTDGVLYTVAKVDTKSDKYTEPPIGLVPRSIWDCMGENDFIHTQARISRILDAMERYGNADKAVPVEWVTELRERLGSKRSFE